MTSSNKIPFAKLDGAGNDFVFLSREQTKLAITRDVARRLLDRHYGVGGDQLLVYQPGAKKNPPELEIYNADGSTAEMCGNGVRAVANYLLTKKQVKKSFVLKTKAGPIGVGIDKGQIEVNMGRPIFEGAKIPTTGSGEIQNFPLSVDGKEFSIHAISMGNPHCVIFAERVASFPVPYYGPLIERHDFFPNRVNVEFVEVLDRGHVRARVWERGAGETLACGTGACAIAVASARAGKTDRNVKIDLPGGSLKVRWASDGHVYLSGPANINFEGWFFLKP